MIKCRKVFPCLRRVAHGASRSLSLGLTFSDALSKLATMRIGMTCCAGKFAEVVTCRTVFFRRFVAVNAGNGHMSAGQFEINLLVLGKRHGRLVKVCFVVALLTTIQIRCVCKLATMHILVAIQTQGELDFVEGRLSRRGVTLCTNDVSMLLPQRKCRLAVFADAIL